MPDIYYVISDSDSDDWSYEDEFGDQPRFFRSESAAQKRADELQGSFDQSPEYAVAVVPEEKAVHMPGFDRGIVDA